MVRLVQQLKDLKVGKRARSFDNPEEDCQLLAERHIEDLISSFDAKDLLLKGDGSDSGALN